ncbi:hypothetical protein H8356DRAFT_1436829 [Neocallimastix lanati (nom. inval.)]|nr:hypothetical protein H8356DRAFT_1436829 [Neocallimastix sp. JGI-2020a]
MLRRSHHRMGMVLISSTSSSTSSSEQFLIQFGYLNALPFLYVGFKKATNSFKTQGNRLSPLRGSSRASNVKNDKACKRFGFP